MIAGLNRLLVRRRDAALDAQIPPDGRSWLTIPDARYPQIEALLTSGDSPWSISHDLARLLAHTVVDSGRSSVLEFGAGLSSLVLATALSMVSGGRLTSVEQNPEWCRDYWSRVTALEDIDSSLVESKPRLTISTMGVCYSFRSAAPAIASRGPYDLALVDAPLGFYGRDGALQMLRKHLAPGAAVILDDAGRNGERWATFRCLATYRGFELVSYDKDFGSFGCAVLVWNGDTRVRPSLLAISTSVVQAARYWWGRRKSRLLLQEWT